jgi:DNA repair exonuclease SbcCD nuclease subunit
MILFSDVHLREETADIVFNQVFPGIEKIADERGDMDLVCLGDLLHFRYKVAAWLFNELHDQLKRWTDRGFHVHLLPGNHDQYDTLGRNALEPLADIYGVTVLNMQAHDIQGQAVLCVPYHKDTAFLQRFLEKHGERASLIFGHFGVRDAIVSARQADEDGVSLPSRHAFMGHYHTPHGVCSNPMVTYVGSPYQVDMSEAGQGKRIIQLHDKGRWESIPVEWGPRYHVQKIENLEQLDLAGVKPGDDVRVHAGAGVDPEKVGALLRDAGVRHVVTPDVQKLEARLAMEESASIRDYAQAYAGLQCAGDPEASDSYVDALMAVFDEVANG